MKMYFFYSSILELAIGIASLFGSDLNIQMSRRQLQRENIFENLCLFFNFSDYSCIPPGCLLWLPIDGNQGLLQYEK